MRPTRPNASVRRAALVILMAGAVACAGLATAQQDDRQERDRSQGRDAQEEVRDQRDEARRPALTRAQLERQREETQQRIESLQQRLQRIDSALERLGEEPASELRELAPAPSSQARRLRTERGEDRALAPDELATDPRGALLDAIAEQSPELARRLRRMRAENPEEFGTLLRRVGPRFRELSELRSEDPQLAALRARELAAGIAMASATRQLAGAVRSGDTKAAEEARVAVIRALERSFDAREASARLEMLRLRERLGSLESEVQDRRGRRDAIIADQMRRIEHSLDRLVERETPERGQPRRRGRGGDGGGE